jgi:hypothetical protein
MKIEETVYEFLKKKRTDHQLYLDIIELVKQEKDQTTKENNSAFYGVLAKLENSINNAGHEKRRSNDISYLWEQKKILYANSTIKDEDTK